MTTHPIHYDRLNPPERTLLSPDLSNASPRARQGLIATLQGATDPSFLKVLDETLNLLRNLLGTQNTDTFILPGSEETALEAGLFNVLENGDTAIVGVTGFFGDRMAEAAERTGATVIRIIAESGDKVDHDTMVAAINQHKPKLVAVLHGDGSTGVEQPLEGLAKAVHAQDALLLVDARWTLGALELKVDAMGIDICVAGSQKAMSAYPGLGLITFSPSASKVYEMRKEPVVSLSLDLQHLRTYTADDRAAQTVPAPIMYAFTEMLQLTYEQGMEYRIRRHANRRDALVASLETLGLTCYAKPECRLPTVTAINVPSGIDTDRVRHSLRTPYRIDIGVGLGELRRKVWRVGVMSHSAQPTFLLSLVTLLETILSHEGHEIQQKGLAGHTLLSHLDP